MHFNEGLNRMHDLHTVEYKLAPEYAVLIHFIASMALVRRMLYQEARHKMYGL